MSIILLKVLKTNRHRLEPGDKIMKRSKKPLTFTAIAAGIGALSLAVEGCVYGPPPRETNVYGPPPDITSETEQETETEIKFTDDTVSTDEVCVYGPAPDDTVDSQEADVYGPPPETTVDNYENDVYGPPPDDADN